MDESAAGICIGCRIGISGIQCECCGQAEKGNKESAGCLFLATGTTKSAAKKEKKATGGKLYQIKAAKPYTSADLSYDNDNCRANVEQQDGTVRPKIKGKVKNIKKYDVIFQGYAGGIIGLN